MGYAMCSLTTCGQPAAVQPVQSRHSSRPCSRRTVIRCQGSPAEKQTPTAAIRTGLLTGLAAVSLACTPLVASAAVRLPPLDNDPNRCERAFTGNTIGQANAVSDKLLDLRKCNLHGKNLQGITLSGALLVDADLSNTNLKEVVMSKAYAIGANFAGADFSNAVLDRVAFDKGNFKGAKFTNAILTGTTFADADLTDADFTTALVGGEDAKRLCLNPSFSEESRALVGCRPPPKTKAR